MIGRCIAKNARLMKKPGLINDNRNVKTRRDEWRVRLSRKQEIGNISILNSRLRQYDLQ